MPGGRWRKYKMAFNTKLTIRLEVKMLKCLNLSQECRPPLLFCFCFCFAPVCKQQPQLCREVCGPSLCFVLRPFRLEVVGDQPASSSTHSTKVKFTHGWAMGIIIVLLKPFHMYWTSPSLITFSTKITINLMPHAWSRSFSNPSIDSTAVYS